MIFGWSKHYISKVVFWVDNQSEHLDAKIQASARRRSICKSLSKLSQQNYQKFLWLGILAPESNLTPALTAKLWQIPLGLAQELLDRFTELSLLSKPSDSIAQYVLPQTTHAVACDIWHRIGSVSLSGDPLTTAYTRSEAHAYILQRYLQSALNGQWHTISADGYFHDHFLWHIEQSGCTELIHPLLQEQMPSGQNGWFAICRQMGRIDLFVATLEQAIMQTKRLFPVSPTRALTLQCHYALEYATSICHVQQIPIAWFGALLKTQLWTPHQVLSYVTLLPDPLQKARAIQSIAPFLPHSHISSLISLADAMQSDAAKAMALQAIAPYLPDSQANHVLTSIGTISEEHYQALVLNAFIPWWPSRLIPKAFKVVLSLQDETARTDVLQDWIPHLPNKLLAEVYDVTLRTTDMSRRLALLIPLAARGLCLNSEIENALLQIDNPNLIATYQIRRFQANLVDLATVLNSLELLSNSFDLSQALCQLSSQLPESAYTQVWAIAQTIPNEIDRVVAIAALSDRYPTAIAPRVQDVILQLQSIDTVAMALDCLGHLLSCEDIIAIANQMLSRLGSQSKAILWTAIAKNFPGILPETLAYICENLDPTYQLKFLSSLLLKYPQIREDFYRLLPKVDDDSLKAQTIVQIGQYLSEEQRYEALNLSLSMYAGNAQDVALGGLADFLSQDQLSWGLAQIFDNSQVSTALENTAKQLNAYCLETISNHANINLSSHPDLTFIYKSTSILEQDKLILPPHIKAILAISEPYYRACALRGILHQLDPTLITAENFETMIDALLKGNGLDLIQGFSLLIPAILNISDASVLEEIALSCHRIKRQWAFTSQNICSTSHKDLLPESRT